MCGINGILYFNSYCYDKPASFFDENIRNMNTEIEHRGPDGEGVFIDYPLCLGHKRLSIIDLSKEANQPMFNEDKSVVLVYNGEIYNYLELIPELKRKGHFFKTKSDTEVIIHSYEEYGYDCVNRFNGMWAFVLYDFKKKILFASRDRFGVKPFFYFTDKKRFIFSSEIKAILRIEKIDKANLGKVYDYLAYGYKTSNGETFFQEIQELEPSHFILIENEKVSLTKYWDLQKRTDINENLNVSTLNTLLIDSVKLRFRSDVPVSILLSGGLDSSIIAKVTDELIENGTLEKNDVVAYSAIFPGFKYDESAFINEFIQTCKHIKSEKIIPDEKNLIDSLNDFVYGMGEPVFSTTSLAHYFIMKEMKKQNIKVVLNGQGADEAWCGYDRYIVGYFLLDLLFSYPDKFFSGVFSISDKMGFTYKYILLQTVKAILSRKYTSYLRAKYQEKILKVLSEEFITKYFSYFKNPDYNKISSNNLVSYSKYNIQYQGFNQILHYEDHSSMQNSIEIRSPFIDYRLMEFAFSLPSEKKIDNGITKKILREIFKNRLPDSILNNYQKIGFQTPFDDWLNQSRTQKFLSDLLMSESFTSKSIWNAKKINKIFHEKDNNPNFPFWRIINLELWSQIYGIKNL